MFFQKKNKLYEELGYYTDQKGILERYYREQEGWDKHLAQTKRYILDSLSHYKNNSVAVLGSGWLLDLPLKELSDHFKTLTLFDIFHPREIKQKCKKYKNVFFEEMDISGGAAEEAFMANTFLKRTGEKKNISEFQIKGFQYNLKFDMYISLNILNQLDIIPGDYLLENNVYTESELMKFRMLVQKAHLDSLPKGKTCLITDFEETIISDKDNSIIKKPLIHINLPENNTMQKWQWDFDLTGNYYKNKKTIFNVVAVNL